MANDLVPYSQALSDPATTASSLESTDVIAIAREDSARPTGFKSMVTRLLTLAKKIVSGIDYSTELTETTAKTITGAINEVAQNSGSVDITTAIDTPASVQTFNDGGDNIPLKSLVTEIVPIQSSGTPSPSNPLSISGFSAIDVNVQGKNWATYSNQKLINSVTPTITNGNVKVACSGSSVQFHQIAYTLPNSKKLAGKTITVSYDTVVTSSARVNDWRLIFISYVNGGSETVLVSLKSTDANHATLNIGNSVTEIVVLFRLSQSVSDTTGDYVTWNKVQLEIGDENTTFEEYTDTTHTVSLGQTVYGGSLECVEGEGRITYGYVEFDGSSDEDWSYATGNKWATITIPDMMSGANQDGITNWLPKATSYGNFGFALGRNNNNFYAYQIPDISGVTDLASWKTYLSNNHLQVVYPLATPTSLSVSGANIPTLSGLNNVYTDCGDTQSLEYFNDNANDIASMVRLMTRT